MIYKYKMGGVICPYLMQFLLILFLIFFWVIMIRSGTPFIGFFIAAGISLVVILFTYTGYPARFEATPQGLKIDFVFEQEAFFRWEDVQKFQVTGPIGVIVVRRCNWASRIFNKYSVFLWLLTNGPDFKKLLQEKTATKPEAK